MFQKMGMRGMALIIFAVLLILTVFIECRKTNPPGAPQNTPSVVMDKTDTIALSVWPEKTLVTDAEKGWPGLYVIITNNDAEALYVQARLFPYPPEYGLKGPLHCHANDHHGRPVTYSGPLLKLGKLDASCFVLVEPRHCYGVVLDLRESFDGLKKPGTYTVRFRYENLERPSGLPPQKVWTGQTKEVSCSIEVR